MLVEMLVDLLGGLLTPDGITTFSVAVEGDGMRPVYPPGTRLRAKPVRRRRLWFRSVVVMAAPDDALGWSEPERLRHRVRTARPGDSWVLRIAGVPGGRTPDGDVIPPDHYYLRADNPAAPDSRLHGPCPRELIFGVIPGSTTTCPAIWPPKT